MDRKGKCYLSVRAKIAAFSCVAIIAFLVVVISKSLISSNSEQTIIEQPEIHDEFSDQSIVDSHEKATETFDVEPDNKSVSALSMPETHANEESDLLSDHSTMESDEDLQTVPLRTFVKQEEDYNVIPDRYNCGAKGNLTKVGASELINGIQLKESKGVNAFNFYWSNKDIEGEHCFVDYDFSDYNVAVYDADNLDREITLVFENCKFSVFRSLSRYPRVNLVFNNCTFNSFYGSCAKFERCKFGEHYEDGIVPFHDVDVENCYFSNFSTQNDAATGLHTDGTQIYGKEGIDAENIHYEHCRFEAPPILGTNLVNACIMLQMEYSNGINISFNNCICNGGGYSIYALSKDKGFEYYENVSISNIAVGQSGRFGSLYPNVAEGVDISNISDIKFLYVGSIWKEDGKTHLSVTNDTLQERKLVVNADGVIYEYVIPASIGGNTDHYEHFEDYPIDRDIIIDSNCQYVICFDQTLGEDKQIRFETWDGSNSISIPWEE